MSHLSRRHRAALYIVAIASLWALAAAGLAGAATAGTRVSNTYEDAQSYMATLTAPVPQDGDGFGYSVAIDGDAAAVARFGAMAVPGSPLDLASRLADLAATGDPAAYVFDKSAAGWSSPTTLSAPAGALPDDFMRGPVARSGDTVVWGAPWHDGTFMDEGAAYAYTGSGASWSSPVTIAVAGAAQKMFGRFGSSAAIDDDTLVIGIPGAGAAQVFTRSGGIWSVAATLVPDGWDGTQGGFAEAVDISGDTIAVAWPGADSLMGAVYLYQGSGAAWSRVATLQAPPGAPGFLFFGGSVGIDDDDLVVGTSAGMGVFSSSARDVVSGCGLAYAFRRTAGVWDGGTTITAPVPEENDGFGAQVAVDSGVALASAWDPSSVPPINAPEGGDGSTERGAIGVGTDKAHLFHRTASGWTHDATLTCAATDTGFGGSLALSDDSALIGAPGGIPFAFSPTRLPLPVGDDPGAAYVFDLLGPNAAKNFKGVPASGKVTLSWSNPATDWARTKIMRSTTGYVESMASLRTARATGVQVYSGTGGVFANTGLTNGVLYYYSAFTQDPEGRYGPVAKASARAGVASGSERLVLSLTTPGSPTEDERFCTSGTFGPTHYVGAKITLWFWFWNGKSWVLYPIRPSSTVGSGSGRWRICTTLPWPGRWRVRAFHKDSWNSGQWSNTRSVWVNRDAGDRW